MRKLFFTALFLFGFYVSSQAQFRIGGHFGPAFPMGEYSDFTNTGFGVGGEAKYLYNENVAFGIDISWYSFPTGFDNVKSNITPFLFSTEFLIPQTSGFTPYFGLGAGPYRVATRVRISGFNSTDSYTKFGVAPVIGAFYALNDQLDINANLKVNFVFTEDETTIFIPLNVGVLFKIP